MSNEINASAFYWRWIIGLAIGGVGAVLIAAISFPYHVAAGIGVIGIAVYWFWRSWIIV
jgi:hypothetical protein